MPVLYRLSKDNRAKSATKGQFFARAVQVGTIDIEALAKIMQANCTIKAADIKALLTELVETMTSQLQNAMRVKLDGLGAFKIGIRGKGSPTVKDYSVAKHVKGLRVNFLPETKTDNNGNRKQALLSGAKVQEAPKNDLVKDPATPQP